MAEPEYQKFLTGFKIRKFRKEIDPSEILLDSLAHQKEKEIGVSEKKLETPISRRILHGFLVVFFVVLLLLFGKTFQLQVMEGKELSQLAAENQFAIYQIQAERGVIYDRNMNQLVFNKPTFDLVCQTNDLPEDTLAREEIFKKVVGLAQLDFQSLKEEIENSELAQVTIAQDLPHQSIVLLEARHNELSGFEVVNNSEREYVSGPTFAHLIGYKRKTGDKSGLEKQYDNVLSSKPGEIRVERDVYGRPISKKIASMPESGDNLVLWLDASLQEKITKALQKSISNVGGTGGTAIALDPKTGGVLALVSWPNYDNNLFSKSISLEEWEELQSDSRDPLFNRAISGIGYPTGSTIKPFIGAAALEEGIIEADTRLYCPLEICIENPYFPEAEPQCYADWKYHGTSNLARAIAESVNTFFYQIGGGYEDFKGLGPTKIKKWLERFNWWRKTEIDLPKEEAGIPPNLEDEWTTGDTYHLSIGQGPFSVTPIQVASAYVALANGGKVLQPQVVKEIINSEKEVIRQRQPKVLKEVAVLPENLETVRQGMRQAVASPDGSSYALNFLPVAVAAKTGTAQTGKEEVYHNWITVLAPHDDPEIVLTVMVENVKGTPQGIPAAVLPVAREVLGWYFSAR